MDTSENKYTEYLKDVFSNGYADSLLSNSNMHMYKKSFIDLYNSTGGTYIKEASSVDIRSLYDIAVSSIKVYYKKNYSLNISGHGRFMCATSSAGNGDTAVEVKVLGYDDSKNEVIIKMLETAETALDISSAHS